MVDGFMSGSFSAYYTAIIELMFVFCKGREWPDWIDGDIIIVPELPQGNARRAM